MKTKNFNEKLEIPEDIELELDGSTVKLKGKSGEVSRYFKMPGFKFANEGNSIVVSIDKYGVYENEKFKTIQAHIKNMIQGIQEGFVYKLKICSSHFPMNVAVSGNKFVVKNLFGEKVPRELIIKEGAKVEVKGDAVEVSGPSKEIVAQVAADIEKLTKITKRDRRIFQDGIYIVSKNGKPVI